MEEAAPEAGLGAQKASLRPHAQGPVQLADIGAGSEIRQTTGIAEFDRVLGGGLVRGALILVGGDPGIGKSTLLLQAVGNLVARGETVLYVTGEESLRQVKMRAERLDIISGALFIQAETNFDAVKASLPSIKPKILVVDSIQTIGTEQLEGTVGSVAQIRAVTAQLMRLAKDQDITTFVVGHVTKEGAIAGPKVMEHMVDTVLYFEGERTGPYRILRAHKNRFGSAQEIGIFEMGPLGLAAVSNPSELFLAQRAEGAGATVVTSAQGSRPLLLEVQALVTPAFYGGTPRRTTTGFDPQRVAMLCAVLGARAGLDFTGSDVFVNVAGGVRLSEPATDLGVVLALASAASNIPIPLDLVAIGEVGLSGEVRGASNLDTRLAEAAALGFGRALIPAVDAARATSRPPLPCVAIRNVQEALTACGIGQDDLTSTRPRR